jgi:tRNA-dihydrouridine synthase A
MAGWDRRFLGDDAPAPTLDGVEQAMVAYLTRLAAQGQRWFAAARHMMGLRNGLPGARRWRQVWSDHRLEQLPPAEVAALARQAEPAPA